MLSSSSLSRPLLVDHNDDDDDDDDDVKRNDDDVKRNDEDDRQVEGVANDEDDRQIEIASSFVRDALHFRFTKGRRVDRTGIWIHKHMHENWRRFVIVVSVLNCSQIMWNPPHENQIEWIALEVFCVCVFLSDVVLGIRMQPFQYYRKEIWNQLKISVLVITLFDLLLAITGATPTYLRLSWCLRPVFLLEKFRHCRKFFASILRAIPPVARVGFFFLYFLGVFAGLSFVIFGNSGLYTQENATTWRHSETCERTSPFLQTNISQNVTTRIACPPPDLEACSQDMAFSAFVPYSNSSWCNDYFGTFSTASLNLFVLLTTANSPDVALPAYNYSRYSFVFFFAYTAFGIMFMMNILLASIFGAYNSDMKTKLTMQLKKRQRSLSEAFRFLCTTRNNDVMSMKMWLGLVENIHWKRKKKKTLPRRAAEIMFVVAKSNDRDDPTQEQFQTSEEMNAEIQKCHENNRNSGVSFNAFQILMFFLNLHVSKRKDHQLSDSEKETTTLVPLLGPLNLESLLPGSIRARLKRLRLRCSKLERMMMFNRFFDFLSFVSILLSIVSIMTDENASDEDPSCSMALIVVSVLFSVLFTLEVLIKILGLGVTGYFSSSMNCLDCLATFGYWTVLSVTSGKFCGSNVIYLFVLRTVRLLRILYVFFYYSFCAFVFFSSNSNRSHIIIGTSRNLKDKILRVLLQCFEFFSRDTL